jgi:hypothetical protein
MKIITPSLVKLMPFILMLLTFIFSKASAQITSITKFTYSSENIKESCPVSISDSKILLTYELNNQIFSSLSTDGGITWQSPKSIIKMPKPHWPYTAFRTSSGRILLAYSTNAAINIYYSDDDDVTWKWPTVTLPNPTGVQEIAITQSSDNTIWLSYGIPEHVYFRKSTDGGMTWLPDQTFSAETWIERYLTIIETTPNNFIGIYQDNSSGNFDIYKKVSTDNGNTWSHPIKILDNPLDEERPKVLKSNDGTIWLIYQMQKPTVLPKFKQYDIYYTKSTDNGVTWQPSTQFTRYIGNDFYVNAAIFGNSPLLSFVTIKRFPGEHSYCLALALINKTLDINPPPLIYSTAVYPPDQNGTIHLQVTAIDETAVSSVIAKLEDGTAIQLYDDGTQGDSVANDHTYSSTLNYHSFKFDVMDINNLKLTLGNSGIIADVRAEIPLEIIVTDVTNISVVALRSIEYLHRFKQFDGETIIFSGGFYLSGLTNGQLWANAVASADRINDYQAGKVGMNPKDPRNKLYFVSRTDPPFGAAWQNWRDAVSLGAYFYDGDNDGIYNPVDKNRNGIWDANEDMPDILGDKTAWCVYNDGVVDSMRRYKDVSPQGIEVRQTVFASSRNPNLSNVIFIRYSFLNTGLLSTILDGVYFSAWSDVDLGDYTDDLGGCDTLLNTAYVYNDSSDSEFGINPPTVFINLLQGPIYYTGNSSDTAYNLKGKLRGIDKTIGYKNLGMTSAKTVHKSHLTYGVPRSKAEARNYQLGLDHSGSNLNPCLTSSFWVVRGADCNSVNPIFMLSGDPVTNIGWLDIRRDDKRVQTNTGPFKLEVNKPIDIIVAYTAGRGSDFLNSITVARNITQNVINEYRSNFGTSTSVDENQPMTIKKYFLGQNYPNPFNPSTVISYQLSAVSYVTLKVYDILGKEIETLVDEVLEPGIHHSTFHIPHSAFTSGVYFYQLRAGNFVGTKKMMIMK